MPLFFLNHHQSGPNQPDAHTAPHKIRFKAETKQQPCPQRYGGYTENLISSTQRKHPLHEPMQGV